MVKRAKNKIQMHLWSSKYIWIFLDHRVFMKMEYPKYIKHSVYLDFRIINRF